ncbi:hypothetical protein MMC20_003723 [Loxospora ochrophaea]|nr:hypothetical protein [Loxospora ochrophaea]
MGGEARHLKIGLAVGYGTGQELVDIFKRVIDVLASYHKLQIEFHYALRVYHSYLSLLSIENGQLDRDEEITRDAASYEKFCKDEAARGTRVIFRTAITAQSLYLVRLNLMAIKIERFNKGSSSLLLIRDQAQGFYTGLNECGADNETVSRTCQFSKQVMGRIVSYSLRRARETWADDVTVAAVTMVYKHHLFNGIFDVWASDWSKELGVQIKFIQPDTMNRNLLAFGLEGHQLVIASNEYADIMEVMFLNAFDQRVQETCYAENVYLHPELQCLSEYQTVHGSADDLVGKNAVNPSATIRAAAAILEQHGGCHGIEKAMDGVLESLLHKHAITPDQGGNLSTSQFVDLVLETFAPPLLPEPDMSSASEQGRALDGVLASQALAKRVVSPIDFNLASEKGMRHVGDAKPKL